MTKKVASAQREDASSKPQSANNTSLSALDVDDTSQPCTLKGLTSAFYAGALGYLFGFVPAMIKNKARNWGAIHVDGVKSAQTFAIMSGLYTGVQCICQRLRQRDDGLNRALAGCSTGLVLGWGGGPWGAAQSCLGIGALSYFLDMGTSGQPAAQATDLCCRPRGFKNRGPLVVSSNGQCGGDSVSSSAARWAPFLKPRSVLAVPPVMWLATCSGNAGYFTGCNTFLANGRAGP